LAERVALAAPTGATRPGSVMMRMGREKM
jgi:hypothetical protein